jgi:hypothetical protein
MLQFAEWHLGKRASLLVGLAVIDCPRLEFNSPEKAEDTPMLQSDILRQSL